MLYGGQVIVEGIVGVVARAFLKHLFPIVRPRASVLSVVGLADLQQCPQLASAVVVRSELRCPGCHREALRFDFRLELDGGALNGVVVERFLHPGEYVEDQPILKLAQVDPLNVEVILPVEMLGSVKVGMRATVKPEAPVTGFYSAKVKIVDKVVDAASGTFGVRLELPNPDYQLPPGLKCKVVFAESFIVSF